MQVFQLSLDFVALNSTYNGILISFDRDTLCCNSKSHLPNASRDLCEVYSMKIKRLTLHNYRCYDKLEINLDPDITVLVGRNGQGKTAVLDAIAVAFGPYIGGFDEGTGQHFLNQDARKILHEREGGRMDMETLYPVSVEASGELRGENITWQRFRKSLKGRTTIKESAPLVKLAKGLQDAVRAGENVTLPLLAYYGTGRLWKKKRLTEKKQAKGTTSRLSGSIDCLNPESSYRAFADWLRMETMVAYEQHLSAIERGKDLEKSDQRLLLKVIQGAVKTVMAPSGWKNIRFSPSVQEVILIGSNGAGKSNFVSYFRMLGELVGSRLQNWTTHQGSPHLNERYRSQ